MTPLPFPSPPYLKALLQPGPDFACLAHMNDPLSCCRVKNGVPVIKPPHKRQLLGCRGSQVPVPPLLSSSLPEAAPSPEVLGCCNRISPLLTALDSVFLGTALPKTLENRKQLKALLASFLASAPPFLSRNSL